MSKKPSAPSLDRLLKRPNPPDDTPSPATGEEGAVSALLSERALNEPLNSPTANVRRAREKYEVCVQHRDLDPGDADDREISAVNTLTQAAKIGAQKQEDDKTFNQHGVETNQAKAEAKWGPHKETMTQLIRENPGCYDTHLADLLIKSTNKLTQKDHRTARKRFGKLRKQLRLSNPPEK